MAVYRKKPGSAALSNVQVPAFIHLFLQGDTTADNNSTEMDFASALCGFLKIRLLLC